MPDVEEGATATETTPLVALEGKPEGGAPVNEDDIAEEQELDPELKAIQDKGEFNEKLVGVTAVGAASTSVLSMAVERNPIVYLSGLFGLGMGPYSAFQEHKLTQVKAMKHINELMEVEVDKLKAENERLSSNVDQLEGSVANLQVLEDTLETIRETEGVTLDDLELQLKDSEAILSQMEENLESTIVQNLITVVLNCDSDGDMELDDEEIEKLGRKFDRIAGVVCDVEKLKAKVVECGRSLNAIMEVVRTVLDENTPEEEKIFRLKTD